MNPTKDSRSVPPADVERLMAAAAEGHVSKPVLASLLNQRARGPFLDACARLERTYSEACTARNDPCLASGCSVDGADETCLQPLLDPAAGYERACAAEWIELFRKPENRAEGWIVNAEIARY